VLRFGVLKFVPVNKGEPPVAALYHFKVPVQPVAVKVTDPLPQRELGTPVGATGIGFTVAITSVLGPSQPAALVHETQYEVVVVILG
jgi:hypothetical protein